MQFDFHRVAYSLASLQINNPKEKMQLPHGELHIPTGINQQNSTSLTRFETSQKSALFRAGHSFVPYPPHYRAALAFSAILYPRLPQSSLRSTCPCGRRVGLTVFHSNNTSGLDPACPPVALVLACPH